MQYARLPVPLQAAAALGVTALTGGAVWLLFNSGNTVAVAAPTWRQVPEARLRQSAWIEARLGASVAVGKASETERLGASVAAWVIVLASVTCGSALSWAAETLNAGE